MPNPTNLLSPTQLSSANPSGTSGAPGKSEPIASVSGQTAAGQYGFVDPYKLTPALQNVLYGSGGMLSGGPLGTFNQNADQVSQRIAGLSGPLQESLSGIAKYQANNALNATAQNFANAGALGSGAAAQAFGQALANPFAQAQAQLQNSQLGAAGGALSSLLGASTNAYGQAMQAGSGLMEHASGLVAPTYMTNPAYASAQQGQQQGKGALSGLASGIPGLLGSLLPYIM